ncbi:hypothetical protein [Thermofilum sp.]|uniref:hypothetical protein n=1 Tax=Thermofilum sp. TaxID=1961369 RepID=UPI0031602F99
MKDSALRLSAGDVISALESKLGLQWRKASQALQPAKRQSEPVSLNLPPQSS